MKRLTTITLIALLTASSAYAEGCKEHPTTSDAVIGTDGQSADLCTVPTSTPPAGYAPDAKTWPCKNFSS